MVPIEINYPFPRPYIANFARLIFDYVKKGECVTSVWLATAGRRVVNQFLVDKIELFEDVFPEYKKYLCAYIEPLNLTEGTQAGYLRLIGRTLVETIKKREYLGLDYKKEEFGTFYNDRSTYSQLLEALRELLSSIIEKDVEIVLFIGEIDELEFINDVFCNNLRFLWNRFNGKLHYVFLIKDVRLIFARDYFGEELGYLFFQNIIYTPVSNENENFLIDFFERKMGYKLTSEKRGLVGELCDGHPYFLKLAMESLSKKDLPNSPLSLKQCEEVIRSNHEIRAVTNRIIEALTESMRKALDDLTFKEVYDLPGEELQILVSLGIVKKTEGNFYKPFCRLLKDAVLKKAISVSSGEGASKNLLFDSKLGSIIFQGKPVDEVFTRQEFDLLSFFLKHPDKVHSRDDVANVIWGKEMDEKYSDWAIDQLISKLRKKLGRLSVKERVIATIRGRGYRFSQ